MLLGFNYIIFVVFVIENEFVFLGFNLVSFGTSWDILLAFIKMKSSNSNLGFLRHRVPRLLLRLFQRIPSSSVHESPRTSTLHFIRLVLLVLWLPVASGLVGNVATSLSVTLIHDIDIPNIVDVGFALFVTFKVMSIDFVSIRSVKLFMSRGIAPITTTSAVVCTIVDLGLLLQ